MIQCLIVESFAVAAYRCYLPVADPYAAPITAAVLADEAEHLDYGERQLAARFPAVAAPITRWCERAVPVAMAMLQEVHSDLEAIGIDPSALVGGIHGLPGRSAGDGRFRPTPGHAAGSKAGGRGLCLSAGFCA